MNTPTSTRTFEYTNPHPKGKKSLGDCVYRSISIATGKDWIKIYDDLTSLGRLLLSPPNDKATYSVYLDKIGRRIDVKKGNKRLTGKDLAMLNDSKTYVVRAANHLLTVKDGKVRDTWDSGNKSAYIIWEIK